MTAKPFIKWVGGKGQLLSQIETVLPKDLQKKPFTYIEPFVGGGAMLFFMLQKYPNIEKAVINDINRNLTNAFKIVKGKPEKLVEGLKQIEREYHTIKNEENRKEFYLKMRERFNNEKLNETDKTVLLLFLNRTCFNGLYRENSKGKFNVPFGKYTNPTICNEALIYADSEILNRFNVEIMCGDFAKTASKIDKNNLNFFYFDPPYRPLLGANNFKQYTLNAFNDPEQEELKIFCDEINEHGGFFMLSNSDSEIAPGENYFEKLYKAYNVQKVYAPRIINAYKPGVQMTKEILVKNY